MKTTIINKLQEVLNKEYGIFGDIIVRQSNKERIIEIIFEENDYLYDALNCYDLEMNEKVNNTLEEVLEPYGLYMELYNSCIGHIYI